MVHTPVLQKKPEKKPSFPLLLKPEGVASSQPSLSRVILPGSGRGAAGLGSLLMEQAPSWSSRGKKKPHGFRTAVSGQATFLPSTRCCRTGVHTAGRLPSSFGCCPSPGESRAEHSRGKAHLLATVPKPCPFLCPPLFPRRAPSKKNKSAICNQCCEALWIGAKENRSIYLYLSKDSGAYLGTEIRS